MRKLLQKRQKLNNAGMTLVEILIAMAVLSLAIVPLMYSFVNTARYNARAREVQQTTVLAQTVIENCKAFSMEDIEDQLTNPAGQYFMDGIEGTPVKSGNTYYLPKIKIENQKYDVALTLSTYQLEDNAGNVITDYKMMNTEFMNPYLDAMFTINTPSLDATPITVANTDLDAYNSALQEISDEMAALALAEGVLENVNLSTTDILAEASDFEMYRNIRIWIGSESGFEKVKVFYEYSYALTSGSFKHTFQITDPLDPLAPPVDEEVEWACGSSPRVIKNIEFLIYSNEFTASHNAKIENIYFLYNPAYSDSAGVASVVYPYDVDTITVENNLARTDINLHLFKQRNSAYDIIDLKTLEASYTPTITGTGTPTIVYHNMYENVADEEGSTTQPALGGSLVPIISQTDYNAAIALGDPKPTMYETTDKELMYTVVVEVYKAGAFDEVSGTLNGSANPVLIMDGTVLDW